MGGGTGALTLRAYAKVNWSLCVTGRRADGYHTLDMIMESISLHDTLTFAPADGLTLSVDGAGAGWDEGNLVCRAADALKRRFGVRGGAAVTLAKRIPARAGLGGGSADAAAALRGLCALWGLRPDDETLREIGLTLGADVPFALTGGLARVRGIGERVESDHGAPRRALILAMPPEGLSTPEVFRRFDADGATPGPSPGDLRPLAAAGDWEALAKAARNDLTAPALALSEGVRAALRAFSDLGARFFTMSGSGACCFGVADDPEPGELIERRLAGEGFAVIRAHTVPRGLGGADDCAI